MQRYSPVSPRTGRAHSTSGARLVHGENDESVWKDPAEYPKALRFFVEHGIPTPMHAIGDAAARTFSTNPIPVAGALRRAAHRIETIPDDLVPRFAEIGVAASMQPIHGAHHTPRGRGDNWYVRSSVRSAPRRDGVDRVFELGIPSCHPLTSLHATCRHFVYDPHARCRRS